MTCRVIINSPVCRIADVLGTLHAVGLTSFDVLCDETSSAEESKAREVIVTVLVSQEKLQNIKRVLERVGGAIEVTVFENAFAN